MPKQSDAFTVEDRGDHLIITAKLADGAQLGRRDRWVFKRKMTFRRKPDGVHFRVAVGVLVAFDVEGFPAMARSAKLHGELYGVGIALEHGILQANVPTAPEMTKGWTAARQCDTVYKLIKFTIPMYRALGSDRDSMTPVEICVSRWAPERATELPAWVLKTRS